MSTRLFVNGIIGLLLIGLVGISACGKKELHTEAKLSMKEAGIPTTIEELGLPEIPDEENGALVYREIFKLKVSLHEKYKELSDYFPYYFRVEWDKVPEEEKNKVINLILHNPDFAQLYQLLEKASQMECQFFKKEDYKEGIEGISGELFTVLSYLRSYARDLAGKAKMEAEYGDANKALRASLIGLKLPKCLSNEPFLISQLVRIAMNEIALATLEEVVNKAGAEVDLYQALVGEMEGERKVQLIHHALKKEIAISRLSYLPKLREAGEKEFEFTEEDKEIIEKYAGCSDEMRKMIEKNMREGKGKLKGAYIKSGLKTPEEFFERQEISYLEKVSEIIILSQESHREARGKFKEIEDTIQKLPDWQVCTRGLLSGISRAYIQEAKLDAHLGAAEIAVANRIYKQKHGKYVDSLEQLTPEILPVLPLDPFTGKDYIYKKKDKGFIVYSLGENLRDDGGLRRKAREKDYDIVWECAS
jgi:hypothetical protein